MSKTLLIIQREFLTRVKKKSFVIMTILTPFIIAAIGFVPVWLASIEDDKQDVVALYDATGHYAPNFKDDASYRYVPIKDPDKAAYYSDTTSYEAVIAIRGDLTKEPDAVTIYSHKEVPAGLLNYTQNVLNEQIRRDKLEATGIQGIDRIIKDVQSEITVPTVKRNAQGEDRISNTNIAIAIGFVFTFMIYIFVTSYGGMVMASIMEEKTNRIVELMVSSVKPFQLMMGKIIGISLVGFAQLAIWALMFVGIFTAIGLFFGISPEMSQQMIQGGAAGASATPGAYGAALPSEAEQILSSIIGLPYFEMILLFILYFIGGYLLYASFFAAIGASVNEQEDSSQFMMPVILIMLFGFYAAMGAVNNTNGPLAFWASLFPLTSPMVMMIRIPFGVPLWQEILSLFILFATAILFVWAGSRIYRVGILMYGKKPTIKEMIKWMRYK